MHLFEQKSKSRNFHQRIIVKHTHKNKIRKCKKNVERGIWDDEEEKK